MACHLCRLKVEAVYHSSRPQPAGLAVTTLVSLERLHFLKGLCDSWTGPLIAAAYLPLVGEQALSDDNAMETIREAFHKYEPQLGLLHSVHMGCGQPPHRSLVFVLTSAPPIIQQTYCVTINTHSLVIRQACIVKICFLSLLLRCSFRWESGADTGSGRRGSH